MACMGGLKRCLTEWVYDTVNACLHRLGVLLTCILFLSSVCLSS